MSVLANTKSIFIKAILGTGLAMSSMLALQAGLAANPAVHANIAPKYSKMGGFQVANDANNGLELLAPDHSTLTINVATKKFGTKPYAGVGSNMQLQHQDNTVTLMNANNYIKAQFAKNSKLAHLQTQGGLPVITVPTVKPINFKTLKDGYLVIPDNTQNFVLFVTNNPKVLSVKKGGKGALMSFALDTDQLSATYLSLKDTNAKNIQSILNTVNSTQTIPTNVSLDPPKPLTVKLDALVGFKDPNAKPGDSFIGTQVDAHLENNQDKQYIAVVCPDGYTGSACYYNRMGYFNDDVMFCSGNTCSTTHFLFKAGPYTANTLYHIEVFSRDEYDKGSVPTQTLAKSGSFYPEPDNIDSLTLSRDETKAGSASMYWSGMPHHKIQLQLCNGSDVSEGKTCTDVSTDEIKKLKDGAAGGYTGQIDNSNIPNTSSSSKIQNKYYFVATSSRCDDKGDCEDPTNNNTKVSNVEPLTETLSNPAKIDQTIFDAKKQSLNIEWPVFKDDHLNAAKYIVTLHTDGADDQSQTVSPGPDATQSVTFNGINLGKNYSASIQTVTNPFDVDIDGTKVQTSAIGNATKDNLKFAAAAPSNIQATNLGDTSATITWDDLSSQGAQSYDVTLNGKTDNVTTNSATFDGLTPGTKYPVKVTAHYKDSVTADGNANITTKQGPTPPTPPAPSTPSDIHASSVTDTTATIVWSNASTQHATYKVTCNGITQSTDSKSTTFSGLTANTSYPVTVEADYDDHTVKTGNGSITTAKPGPTPPGPTPGPLQLSLTGVDYNSMQGGPIIIPASVSGGDSSSYKVTVISDDKGEVSGTAQLSADQHSISLQPPQHSLSGGVHKVTIQLSDDKAGDNPATATVDINVKNT